MEIYPSSSSSSSSSYALRISSTVSAISCSLFFAVSAFILTVVLFIVGTTLGGISGAVLGVTNKSGIFHGATVGTIMGCILSAEIFRVSFSTLDSDDSTIACFISVIEYGSNRLKETLLRGRFSPTFHVLQESQADVAHIMEDEIHKQQQIPKITLTDNNLVDTLWSGSSCSICLQDFQLGETVCSLPKCHHTFHLQCICKWFIVHYSCPLCRTRLSRNWIAMVFKMRKEI